MIACRWKSRIAGLGPVILVALLLGSPIACAKKNLGSDNIPKKVMDALNAKFSKAKINEWEKEEEDGVVVYDFEFTQGDRKFEADIAEDGTIRNWEREIAAEDLPEAVKATVRVMYPSCTLMETMEVTAMQDGKDMLEGYEILLKTADETGIEVTVAPDGKILEGPEEEE